METGRFLISPQMAVRHREKRSSYIWVGMIQVLPGITTRSTGQRREPASESFCGHRRVLVHILGPVVKPYTSESSKAEVSITQHARTHPGCLLSLLPALMFWLFWLLTSLGEMIKQDSFVFLDWMLIPQSKKSEQGVGCTVHIIRVTRAGQYLPEVIATRHAGTQACSHEWPGVRNRSRQKHLRLKTNQNIYRYLQTPVSSTPAAITNADSMR